MSRSRTTAKSKRAHNTQVQKTETEATVPLHELVPEWAGWRSLFLVFAVYAGSMGLQFSIAHSLKEYTDGDPLANPVLDVRFGFNKTSVAYTFEAYGEGGRQLYMYYTLLDCVQLVAYAAWMSALLRVGFALFGGKLMKYSSLPVCAAAFDLLENVGLLYLLYMFPDMPDWAVVAALFAQQCKRATTNVVLIALGGCGLKAITLAMRQMRQERKDA